MSERYEWVGTTGEEYFLQITNEHAETNVSLLGCDELELELLRLAAELAEAKKSFGEFAAKHPEEGCYDALPRLRAELAEATRENEEQKIHTARLDAKWNETHVAWCQEKKRAETADRALTDAEEAIRFANEEAFYAGVEFEDERIRYKTVQIDREFFEEWPKMPAVARALAERGGS
jgi:hypothetical protein